MNKHLISLAIFLTVAAGAIIVILQSTLKDEHDITVVLVEHIRTEVPDLSHVAMLSFPTVCTGDINIRPENPLGLYAEIDWLVRSVCQQADCIVWLS